MTTKHLLLLPLLALPMAAQDFKMACNQGDWGGERDRRYCELRTLNGPSSGQLKVSNLHNGGITVRGWDRNEIAVRAKVESWGDSVDEAKSRVQQVTVALNSGVLGPTGSEESLKKVSVSVEVFAPRMIALEMGTHNGGITLSNLEGRIRFATHNGGVTLEDMAGDVEGSTHNGGITAKLTGSSWRGQKLQVETQNGGVKISMPRNYNAQFRVSTVHGGMKLNYPLTLSGPISTRDINTTVGGGGAPVSFKTRNGGVVLEES